MTISTAHLLEYENSTAIWDPYFPLHCSVTSNPHQNGQAGCSLTGDAAEKAPFPGQGWAT